MNNFKVCEIFKSIQGESTYAGSVCSFVRLSGCNLRCNYCDTTYAFDDYTMLPENAIVQELLSHSTSIVEITGGEPLLEKATPSLCSILLEHGFTVLIETNGSIDISVLPAKCIRIIDVKCPGSGMEGSFLTDNIRHIVAQDELKYVLSSYDDFTWALDHVKQFDLQKKCTIIFSPNLNKISASDCAGWIIEGNVPVRLGVQLHKIIWGDKRGV